MKNYDGLTSHGSIEGRKIVLDIIEAGLRAADPYPNIRKMVRIEDGKLLVGHKSYAVRDKVNAELPLIFDLSKVGSVYLFGGGKAVQRMAQAVEDSLGDLITDGQINAKKGDALRCKKVNVTFAGHPIPDKDSVAGAKRKHEIESKVKKGDIVFYFTSGGGSATLTWPAPGLTLEDIQEVTRMLYFEKGASMPEKNRVLSKLRMPRTGKVISGATLIYITSSETPTGGTARHRRFPSNDAIDILKTYELWDKVPQSVRSHLKKTHNDPRYDAYGTPIHSLFYYDPINRFRVMGPEYMLVCAKRRAEELGLEAHILCSSLNDIEASNIGQTLAGIALEVEHQGRPFKPSCVMIFGGEPTVSVGRAKGKGGRNQEFVLSTAPWIYGSEKIVVAACDCDGTDGPTNVAGGVVDGYTMKRAEEAGLDLYEELNNHNSYGALTKLGDTIYTGVLGQNLRSLFIAYIKK
ncbi:MAG: glycerate kinase type-2 family protein [Candidatus Thorarchaeota archaeon]